MGDAGCVGEDGSMLEAAGERVTGVRPGEAVEDSAVMNDACAQAKQP